MTGIFADFALPLINSFKYRIGADDRLGSTDQRCISLGPRPPWYLDATDPNHYRLTYDVSVLSVLHEGILGEENLLSMLFGKM